MKTKQFFFFFNFIFLCINFSFPQGSRKLSLEQTKKEKTQKEAAAPAKINEVPRIELSNNQICNVYALDYSPDGKHLVAGYNNNLVRIWDISTGQMLHELKGHTGVVWSVAYSPDGKMIVSGSADKTIKCWNAENGKLIRTLPDKKGDKGHTAIVSYVTFNPNGTYIASGSSDKSVKFWDSSTGMLLQTLADTHSKTIAAIAYSNSGRYVATASWDNTVKIYHAMGGIERNLLTGHNDAVYAVQFSPDEKYIATGSADRTVRIYDVESGNFIRAFSGIQGQVWSIAYSPDGKSIVTGNSDGSVILFDAETGKKIKSFNGHMKEVRSCVFDISGKHLYTGDSEGIIKMWDVEKGQLVVTMLQLTDGNWVTWTTDGFLTGSEGALGQLSYTVGNKKYSLDEIKSTVYRPDIVAAKMQDTVTPDYSDTDTFADLIARDSAPNFAFEILNTDGSKRKDNKNRDFLVDMKITDTGSGIGNIYIKLNGRAFIVSESLSSTKGQVHKITSPTPLSLRQGKNTVSISVFDSKNKKEYKSDSVEVEWQGNVQKSRLFILAAGVDKYTDKAVAELSGCVADAKALLETSRSYAGDLYLNVFERLLTDKDVTRKNLVSAIKEFGASVQPDDVFILYLAGHGITHTDGDYYFIPYDFKNSGPNPIVNYGLSKWELISALSTVNAENITVILDTCNSASFSSKQPSNEELMRMSKQAIIERMGALSGFDLITACTSTQVALDNFKGHGIFTYCLLDGIKGAADLDQNGQVTSAELATYVIKEVPIQSYKKFGYKQEPQRSQPKFDFPMFGKLNPLEGQSIKEALEIAKLVREKGIDLEAATEQVRVIYVEKGGSNIEQSVSDNIKETDEYKMWASMATGGDIAADALKVFMLAQLKAGTSFKRITGAGVGLGADGWVKYNLGEHVIGIDLKNGKPCLFIGRPKSAKSTLLPAKMSEVAESVGWNLLGPSSSEKISSYIIEADFNAGNEKALQAYLNNYESSSDDIASILKASLYKEPKKQTSNEEDVAIQAALNSYDLSFAAKEIFRLAQEKAGTGFPVHGGTQWKAGTMVYGAKYLSSSGQAAFGLNLGEHVIGVLRYGGNRSGKVGFFIGQNGSVKDKAKVLRIQSAAYAKGWESKAVKSSSSSKEEAEYVFDSEAAFLAYLADYQKVTDDLAEILEAAR